MLQSSNTVPLACSLPAPEPYTLHVAASPPQNTRGVRNLEVAFGTAEGGDSSRPHVGEADWADRGPVEGSKMAYKSMVLCVR
jgi:hypothetical protein